MTDKLRKYCNSNQGFLQPIDLVERMVRANCGRTLARCNKLYRLTKVYSFECPVCRYYHTDVKFSDLYMNQLAKNIIKEYSEDVQVNVQSGVDEAGSSNKVAEVQRDVDLDSPDVNPM